MAGNRRRALQAGDRLGMAVDLRHPFRALGLVAQTLDAARGGTGTNGDQQTAMGTEVLDAFEIFRRRHAALDARHIHTGIRIERPRFGKVHQIDPFGERQQRLAEIEERQLAAVAGTELEHGHARLARVSGLQAHQNPLCASRALTSLQLNTGPSRQTNAPPNWQWPQRPTAHCMLRSMLSYRRDSGRPRASRASAALRIMPSGPHIMATAQPGSKLARLNNTVTRPTCQGHNAAPSLAATNTWVSGNFAQRSYCSRQIRSSACFTPWMMTSLPKRSRRRSTKSFTDTTGAQPRPPVTSTTSHPPTSCNGQPRPNGPRRPTRSPGLSEANPRVTRPSARMEWPTRSRSSGSDMMEIGTSPTP